MAQTKKTKRSTVSSRRGSLVVKSEADIRAWFKTPEAKEEIRRSKKSGFEPSAASLKAIPELTDEELAKAYRSNKQPITVRLDGEVVAWLKGKPGKYQQHLNAILRTAMMREKRSA